jgi:hypothetical protein
MRLHERTGGLDIVSLISGEWTKIEVMLRARNGGEVEKWVKIGLEVEGSEPFSVLRFEIQGMGGGDGGEEMERKAA